MLKNSRFDLTTLSAADLNSALEQATKAMKGMMANDTNFAALNTVRYAYLNEIRRRNLCGNK